MPRKRKLGTPESTASTPAKRARGPHNKEFRTFEDAREYVRTLGLKSVKEWWAWCKSDARPPDIPSKPHTTYKSSGWLSYGDFLGFAKGQGARGSFRSFEDARTYVRTLGLKSQKDWRKWSKSDARPLDISSAPEVTYKGSGWLSYGDFLGFAKGQGARRQGARGSFRSFEDARAYVRTLGLKSYTEWREWRKSRPLDIPSAPEVTYKGSGWLSYGDFLGAEYGKPTNISDLCGLLERAGRPVVSMVKAVAPRLHEVSPLALAAEAEGKQSAHGSRPAMAAVGMLLGEYRRTKLEEDHPDNPRYRLEMAMADWVRAADECLKDLSPLEACWLVRLTMACAFVHVVDDDNEDKDVRAAELTPELKEAVRGFEIYEHGCCGGQRAAMWRHLYGFNTDAAHDYELKYCAERAYSTSGDAKKLTRARVYATTKRAPIIDDVRGKKESLTAWMVRLDNQLRARTDAVGDVHNLLKRNGARLVDAAKGRIASRGWCQVVLGGTTGAAAIKRATTHDIMRMRGSKKAATTTPAEAVCCGDDDSDDSDDDDDEANQATP